jgi:hypothetical protein
VSGAKRKKKKKKREKGKRRKALQKTSLYLFSALCELICRIMSFNVGYGTHQVPA